MPTFSSNTDPAPAGAADSTGIAKQSAAAVERSLLYLAVMLRPAFPKSPPQLICSMHGDENRGALLKQRVVPRILEHGCKTRIVVDRAGGGDGTGSGITTDGIAAYVPQVERPVGIDRSIDIDIGGAARVLLIEFCGGHRGPRQRTEEISGSIIQVDLACEARTVHTNRRGQQCCKAQGGGRLHALTSWTFDEEKSAPRREPRCGSFY